MLDAWILSAGRALLALALGLVITFTAGHTAEFGLIAFGVFAVVERALARRRLVRRRSRSRSRAPRSGRRPS